MNEPNWALLYERIHRLPAGKPYPLSPVTDSELDEFEKEMNIRLPLAYRSFIKAFGPGGFVYQHQEQCSIFAPYCKGNSFFDMRQFNTEFRIGLRKPARRRSYTNPESIERLVFFGRTVHNDYYAWDSAETSDESTFDRPVHLLRRLGQETATVASGFVEYVERHCIHGSVSDLIANSESNSPDNRQCLYFLAQSTPQGRRALNKANTNSTAKPKKSATPKKRRPKK